MMFKIPKRILLRDMCNYVLGFGVSRIQTNPKNVCMCIHIYIYIHTHTLDYITLHCIAMHCIAYHYITLHNIHNSTLKKTSVVSRSTATVHILLFLFLQIFLKRAAKPSLGNTSGGFPWIKWPQIPLNLIRLCAKASQTFSGTFSATLLNLTCLLRALLNLTWLCTKASRNLLRNLRNLLRNLVEPDPAPAPVHTGAILGWRPH